MDTKVMEQRLEQWMPIFEAQAKSGLGKGEWCKTNGIRRWEFFKRQRECRAFILSRSEAGQVLPVTAEGLPEFFELPSVIQTNEAIGCTQETDVNISENHIDIRYDSFDIRLTGSVDQNTLITLIKAVKNA